MDNTKKSKPERKPDTSIPQQEKKQKPKKETPRPWTTEHLRR